MSRPLLSFALFSAVFLGCTSADPDCNCKVGEVTHACEGVCVSSTGNSLSPEPANATTAIATDLVDDESEE